MIRIALVSIALAFHPSTYSQLLVEAATYYGGMQAEASGRIALNDNGQLFIAGNTSSASGLSTSNAFQPFYAGNQDVLLSKWSPEPSLIWSTYYGSQLNDALVALAIHGTQDVYLAMRAGSSNGLASPGAFQMNGNPGPNPLIARFDANGNRLWATYFTGNALGDINALAVGNGEEIIVAGSTEATSGLTTSGAFLEQYQGSQDIFLARFTNDGQLLWCTYVGGADLDGSSKLTVHNDFIYLIGTTKSSGLALNTEQGSSAIGGSDILLAKFDLSGNPVAIRYFGGSGNDYSRGNIAVTPNGVIIAGSTFSSSGIAFGPSIHQPTPSENIDEGGDLFFAHFDFDLNLQWATYWGGSGLEEVFGVDSDEYGNIYFCGYTTSPGLATADAPQTTIIGPNDAYLACFRPDGSQAFATYFGGDSPYESFVDVKVRAGAAHCAGSAVSPGLATPGAYQQAPAGATDIIYVRYQLPVGIRENTSNEPSVRMHPNPAAHSTLVQWPSHWEVHTLVLTDLSGRQIAAFPLPRQLWATYLDLQSLAPGIYGVHLLTPQGAHFGGRIVKE